MVHEISSVYSNSLHIIMTLLILSWRIPLNLQDLKSPLNSESIHALNLAHLSSPEQGDPSYLILQKKEHSNI